MQVKFRGKRMEDRCWVHGYFLRDDGSGFSYIVSWENGEPLFHRVFPKSVGRWTHYCDAHGGDVYEGDILRDPESGSLGVVMCEEGSFFLLLLHGEKGRLPAPVCLVRQMTVIGNTFDDRELVEGFLCV